MINTTVIFKFIKLFMMVEYKNINYNHVIIFFEKENFVSVWWNTELQKKHSLYNSTNELKAMKR